jgi:hypothetical protein
VKLDYKTELEKIYIYIDESKIMALAASIENHPTVRLMSGIVYEK